MPPKLKEIWAFVFASNAFAESAETPSAFSVGSLGLKSTSSSCSPLGRVRANLTAFDSELPAFA